MASDGEAPMKVTVFGSARLSECSAEYGEAVRLGRELAQRGHAVICGGYGGLMEAVSRGAHDAGGTAVGITMAPWANRLSPNRFLSEERAAETLFARIEALIEGDCLIALPGGAGTLGEVALAWNLRQMDLIPEKPVILVGPLWARMAAAFRDHLVVSEADIGLLTVVETVDEALDALSRLAIAAGGAGWRG